MNGNYTQIGIYCDRGVGGSIIGLVLKNIEIIPQNVINIKPPFYLPVLNYMQTIYEILQAAGYSYDLQFDTSDSNYLSQLGIPFSKEELKYSTRFTDKHSFKASALGTQVINAAVAPTTVQFPTVEFQGEEEWYDDSTYTYNTPIIDYDLRIRLFLRLEVNVTALAAAQMNFALMDGASVLLDSANDPIVYTITAVGTYNFSLELPLTRIGNSTKGYWVRCYTSAGGTNTVSILSGRFYSVVDRIPYGRIHASNLILPDMEQTEFIADFLIRTATLLQERELGTVKMKTLNKIIADRVNAEDWTDKRVAELDLTEFVFDEYGQQNNFNDSNNKNVTEDHTGSFSIDNLQLETEKDIYTSPFVIPEEVDYEGIKVIRIPIFNFESDDPMVVSEDWEPGLRLVYLREEATQDPEVQYNDSAETDYCIAVYSDIASDARADWQYFLDLFYADFVDRLDYTRIVDRKYNLTPRDMKILDLMNLVFDSNHYYIVLKVSSFVAGEPTKVRLFKI
jgi:hypothetical protein